MKIAIEGCAHGELDNIYSTIKEIEEKNNIKIDLLICCGDFQSSRNEEDLNCMAVPPKYRHICSFYKYYNGEKKAPVLTIFIGGNHEASNYLQELPYGGWVAPNIFYLGYAGVIDIAGITIGGLSGIYKGRDFLKGRFEKPPYDENTKRSVYHIRNLEIFRLKQISQPLDIFLSHDWPTGVYNFGNIKQLLKRKPFFKDEIESNQLGSKPCEELLNHLQPKYWFAAHLHCKFAALVPHKNNTSTKFLALDKCLPRRHFLQVVDIPHDEGHKIEVNYNLEWLSILYLTNHLLNVKNVNTYMPGPGGNERYNFTPSKDEKNLVLNKLNNTLKVPNNFRPTAVAFEPGSPKKTVNQQRGAKLNPQTVELCEILGIDDPICLISESNGLNISLDSSFLENTTFISDSDVSDSVDDSESKVESDISIQENKIKELQLPETKPLTPMKLPKPINSEEQAEQEIMIKDKSNIPCGLSNLEVPANSLKLSYNSSKVSESLPSKNLDDKVELNTPIEDKNQENFTKTSCEKNNVKADSEPILSLIDEKQLKTSPKRTLSEVITSDNSGKCESSANDLDSSNSEVKSSTPTLKKFKRRNAGIYTSETADS